MAMETENLEPGALLKDVKDTEFALDVNRYINYYVITPIACTGVSFNCLVLWNLHRRVFTFRSVAMNFLFKALAAGDISYTVFYVLWWYTGDRSAKFILSLPAFGSRFAVVGITLLVTVTRWLAVRFPYKYRSLVTRYRMRVSLLIVVMLCMMLKLSQMITIKLADKKTALLYAVSINCIILSSSIVTEVVLTINLVTTLVKRQRKAQQLTSGLAWNDRRARGETAPKRAITSTRRKTSGITPIVIAISALTFVSYPIGVITITYFKLNTDAKLYPNKRILFAIVNLLQIMNSNANFFIYVCCLPEFRKQMRTSLKGIAPCSSNAVGTTTSTSCAEDLDVREKKGQRDLSLSISTAISECSSPL